MSIKTTIESIIGCILLENSLYEEVQSVLHPDLITDQIQNKVFKRFATLNSRSIHIDTSSMMSLHDDSDEIDEFYYDSCTDSADIDKFNSYLLLAEDYLVKERAKKILRKTISKLDDNTKPSKETLVESLTECDGLLLSSGDSRSTSTNYSDLSKQFIVDFKERVNNPSKAKSLKTDIKELDRILTGLYPSDLIIIAARPSMGKTTFGMNICENVCSNGHRAMVFSLEMPKEQIMLRSIATAGKINQGGLRTGVLTDLELGRLANAVDKVNGYDIEIDDEANQTVMQIKYKAKKAHRKKKLNLIMIDYLGLIKDHQGLDPSNRNTIIAGITAELKALAKELGIPVVLLSQLNRDLEKRADKRPMNSDLRDSGAIEQDADVIMFVYRDEVYNPDSPDKDTAEIIIGKQRNGEIGTIRTRYRGKYSMFDDLTSDADLTDPPYKEHTPYKGNTLERDADLAKHVGLM